MKSQKLLPYLLVLPTMLYLVLFFAYPMISALQLAVTSEVKQLILREAPDPESAPTGRVAMRTEATIRDRQVREELLASGRTRDIYWYFVEAPDVNGDLVTGWVIHGDLAVRSRTQSETGTVENGTPVQEWTLRHINTMLNDFRFQSAILNTFLLIIIILPIQFTLAIIMALILQARPRGNITFLYIYAVPLGISDLAAGLVWLSVFTQQGFLNSLLVSTGLLERPFIFIALGNEGWIILAIVLAEVWRATAIVMVIVVSGLQAVPTDYIEAGQVFGANLWQRIRYIVLPLLRPSLQVALILRTILAFQVFAVVVALSGGEIFTVLANETFRWYDRGDFGYNNPNVASAYAGLIMLISLGISFFYLRAVRTQEEVARSS